MGNTKMLNSFDARRELNTGGEKVHYYSLNRLAELGIADISRLPFTIKILLEALLRSEDGKNVTREDVLRLARYTPKTPPRIEVPFKPARVLLQDFTGVPCLVDLAAMRSAMKKLGGDPKRINPRIPVDLIIDHSVQIDAYGTDRALQENRALEFARNGERYEFLKWGQSAFDNFQVVPPGSGICHQVNLEYLGRVVQRKIEGGQPVAFPDSLVGTDSHTPMINGLGVVGWGVGGIEAEAVMLGQPIHILAPSVLGFRLTGNLNEGVTATDLVLTITEMLRQKGVVGKFVEFYGPGLESMTVTDRATIANMSPECGSTVNYFPVDDQTLEYLRGTGRPPELIELVAQYMKAQGLFRRADTPDPEFEETMELALSTVRVSLAGPNRPHDRITLDDMKTRWKEMLSADTRSRGFNLEGEALKARAPVTLPGGENLELTHGDVVIAAITSCTNTSNPAVLLGAGLLAKKAVEAGLRSKPWVKTSLAPGSLVARDYLDRSGLLPYLETLGFHVVAYGCTTCIGNSGPLAEAIQQAIKENQLVSAAVLSGNRNFEGRISPHVKASFLASPLLVVAYALAGTVNIDLTRSPLGKDGAGNAVFLKDLWPGREEIARYLPMAYDPEQFHLRYDDIEHSNAVWTAIPIKGGELYDWQEASTYIKEPPFFDGMKAEPGPIESILGAPVLVMVGDSVTTDHISPAGAIPADSPAGNYLISRGVETGDFNSFGSRRGNDGVMIRGTFANIRLRNLLAPGTEGGWTTDHQTGEVIDIHEASQRLKKAGLPAIVLAGRDYGMGSSRDWAAKGTMLLGVKAVIARSYERIHRSNLVNMGVLPLEFKEGEDRESLGLTGRETFSIKLEEPLKPGQEIMVAAATPEGSRLSFTVLCRLDLEVEVDTYRQGGILPAVVRGFLAE